MEKNIRDKFNDKNINETHPLSGIGKLIRYKACDSKLEIKWGSLNFKLPYEIIEDILNNFFKDETEWYPLGASVTEPTLGGLGEYIRDNHGSFTPRHASVIASILVDNKLVEFKGRKPIMIKKIL